MALVLSDRVKVRSVSTGTGTFVLGNTAQGFQDFSAIGDGNETYYGIIDNLGNWEIGKGTYTAAGNLLSRDEVVESSNSGNLVDFASGSKNVFCTFPSSLASTIAGFVTNNYSGEFVGNVRGSIFADNSTLLVDGTNGSIPYSVITGVPTSLAGLTGLQFSGGVSVTEFSVDGTLADDSDSAVPTEKAVKAYVDSAIASFDSVGNFTLGSSTIDTDDSSAINITPSVIMNSDLTVENDLTVNNLLTVSRLNVLENIESSGTGTPELFSEADLLITAGTSNRVSITQSPLKFASFTTSQRDAITAENGDVIYNITTNKFQGYANNTWIDLH